MDKGTYTDVLTPGQQTQADPKQRHVVGLDLVRFAAAFAVMAFHYFAWTPLARTSTGALVLHGAPASSALAGVSWFGWIGVEIFFVISGFVIAFSAEHASAETFARQRILRLAPAAWICATITLAVTLLLGLARSDVLAAEYWRAMLFLPFGPYIDGVYWTLAIEVSFYLLVFLLLLFGRFAWIEHLAAFIGIGSAAFLFIMSRRPDLMYVLGDTRWFELLLLRHGVFFAMGVFIWAYARHGFSWRRLALFALALVAGWREIAMATWEFRGGMHIAVSSAIPCAVFTAALAAIVLAIRFNHVLAKHKRLSGALRVLGLATYPLYLVHQLNGAALLRLEDALGVAPLAGAFFAMAVFVVLAILIATGPEPALRRVLKKVLAPIHLPGFDPTPAER